MVLIDGYGRIDFKVDLIDMESKESLKKNIQLHDEFADFLSEVEE
ncbi:hypothetical protein [Pseudobacteroides cellulosolvens]|nr:hypothetical protein [Pseudobacteroides cellulosolvens]